MAMRVSTWKWGGVVAVIALAASACGANGDAQSGAEDAERGSTPSTFESAPVGTFGDLEGVCGPGDATLAKGEAGTSTPGTINIGVATDRNSDIRPGLNKEMWDASVAFAEWCNAAGGAQGLEINLVELDGALFNVEAAMTTACSDVFAMVGGGFAQDQLEFSGKEDSDIELCGLVDIPGFAASTVKASSLSQVLPLVNVPSDQPLTWLWDYKELDPKNSKTAAIVYADIPSIVELRDKYEAGLTEVGIATVDSINYSPAGPADWTPYVQRVIESGATTVMWIGETTLAATFFTALRQQGWDGVPLLESNIYDPLLFSAGNDGPEGAVVRQNIHPFEEADIWPATQQYLDLVDEQVPDGSTGTLGVGSTSAWLLFTTAATACAEQNDGVISRACIIEQAAAQDDWTGGGLHAPQDPDTPDRATASNCGMLMEVRDGAFVRLHPKLDGDGDDIDGFHCPDNGVLRIP